ncbi:MAG: hypothetical protein JEY94_08790 [Melioribacteraceae bacterium]|nr:hypothetical protein [Melioribacteraceae bacterium]
MFKKISPIIITLLFTSLLAAQDYVKVGNVYPGEISSVGFTLTNDGEVNINGMAGDFDDWEEGLVFYGWIIESETRKIAWDLRESVEYEEDEGLYDFDEDIELKAGDYELYFTGLRDFTKEIRGFGDILNKIFGSKNKYKRNYRSKLGIKVTSLSNNIIQKKAEDLATNYSKGAIVSLSRIRDDEFIEKGFTLNAETELSIYAIGEGRSGELFDYGWIEDVRTNRRVWTMNWHECDHAGGGSKNIKFDGNITLPAGSYLVNYRTDDSHSYEEWNVKPPNDPFYWGITVWVANSSEADNIEAFKKVDINKPIISLTKVRDDEFVSQGLSVKKDMKARIFCMGEAANKREMADYGWIVDADTREIVWEMDLRRSEHAGGADKNRMIDDDIVLKKGDYIVYYQTDDSHSYRNWNSSMPYDAEKWGISVWVSPDDKNFTILFDEGEYKSANVLAQITRVRNNERVRKSFELAADSRIRILAIGEGQGGDMADYAWIENDRGTIIWEMTYRKTDHAGGGQKNRIFNDTIMLGKGSYKVYYVSDGSHSYRNWNVNPPRDPHLWGVTIYKD